MYHPTKKRIILVDRWAYKAANRSSATIPSPPLSRPPSGILIRRRRPARTLSRLEPQAPGAWWSSRQATTTRVATVSGITKKRTAWLNAGSMSCSSACLPIFFSGHDDHHREIEAKRRLGHRDPLGGEEGGEAEDVHDVEDVASHDVPDGDVAFLTNARKHGRGHLREGGANSNNGQPDDQLADAEFPRKNRCSLHQPVGPENEQGKTYCHKEYREREDVSLPGGALLGTPFPSSASQQPPGVDDSPRCKDDPVDPTDASMIGQARRRFKKRLNGIINIRTDGTNLYAARRVAAGYRFVSYGPIAPAPRTFP